MTRLGWKTVNLLKTVVKNHPVVRVARPRTWSDSVRAKKTFHSLQKEKKKYSEAERLRRTWASYVKKVLRKLWIIKMIGLLHVFGRIHHFIVRFDNEMTGEDDPQWHLKPEHSKNFGKAPNTAGSAGRLNPAQGISQIPSIQTSSVPAAIIGHTRTQKRTCWTSAIWAPIWAASAASN